jgi:hypothetical protein
MLQSDPLPDAAGFDGVITAVGQRKILAIKGIRQVSGLGLKDAKDLIERIPAYAPNRDSRRLPEPIPHPFGCRVGHPLFTAFSHGQRLLPRGSPAGSQEAGHGEVANRMGEGKTWPTVWRGAAKAGKQRTRRSQVGPLQKNSALIFP